MSIVVIPDVNVAGGTLTVRVPVGPTYDRLLFNFAGTGFTSASVSSLQLKLNGKVVQEFKDVAQLNDLNSYHGRTAINGGLISLWFRRLEAQAFGPASTIDAERVTSLRTGNLSTVELTASINTAVYTAPSISVFGDVQLGRPQPLELFTRIRRSTYNPGGSGDFVISDIPRDGSRIIAAHFSKSDVNTVSVLADRKAVVDAATKTILQRQQTEEGRTPVAGYTVVDFCANGDIDGSLRTAGLQSLDFRLTLGTGGALEAITEAIAHVDQL